MSAAIIVLGLGSGDPDRLTIGNLKKLQQAHVRYVRTLDHPVVDWLAQTGVRFQSFDEVYEQKESFPEVYEEIASRLLRAASDLTDDQELIYAVPGHPMVAESTVQQLRSGCAEQGIRLELLGGESFLDEAFARLGFDPIEGFQLLDASGLVPGLIQPKLHTLIGQVYDVFTASDVKLSLMETYPDDYPVVVGHALGVAGQERILQIPLHDLDRIEGYGNLSLIYISRDDQELLRQRSFERLHEIVGILRSPEGCPWDQEQTHQSIRKNLIEETYEVLETIDEDDPEHMQEELGDLLLQIMLHAQMEEETGMFTVYDVIAGLNDKLIFRHPHVFGDKDAVDAEAALSNWEGMKAEEKLRKGIQPEQQSILSGVPRDLPALMKAYKLQKKASKAGFDWDHVEGAFSKIDEELAELKQAVREQMSYTEQVLELGDVLFTVVNAARFIGADPEEALSLVNRKFTSRFQYVEQKLREHGRTIKDSTLAEMDAFWDEAKARERTQGSEDHRQNFGH